MKMKVLGLAAGVMLSACGGDSSSSDVPAPSEPELGQKSDLLRPLAIDGGLCQGYSVDDVGVFRNGQTITVTVPKVSAVATDENRAETTCRIELFVLSQEDFLRSQAELTIKGRYAERENTPGMPMFRGSLSQWAQWRDVDTGRTKMSGVERGATDRDGVVAIAVEDSYDTYAAGKLELIIAAQPATKGYPVAFAWNGHVRFEISPPR